MKKTIVLDKGESLVEFMYRNKDKLSNYYIVVTGDEEFKKYEVRCSRQTADFRGCNNIFSLKTDKGEFCLSTTSHTNYESGTAKSCNVHVVSEASLNNSEFFYVKNRVRSGKCITLNSETQDEDQLN